MEIVFATHNANKVREVQALMPAHIKLVSLDDLGLVDDIPETASTLSGNAALKANYVKERFDLPVFADDTGLLVDALDNAPGVYSARYAGPQKNDAANVKLLLDNLKNDVNRNARFVTAIAYHSGREDLLFEGVCTGKIIDAPRGTKGFGYDPIFIPDGYDRTFAQMDLQQKAAISHRGRALKKLIEYLNLNTN